MAAVAARRSSGPIIRSISPSSRFNLHYSAHSPSSHQLPASPTRVNRCNYPSHSFSFSLDRTGYQDRMISFSTRPDKDKPQKRTYMCSPTNHPGSFRCSLHKGNKNRVPNSSQTTSSWCPSRLNMRRSAIKNSMVLIGTVEDDFVKRALAALIRPSSQQRRRVGEFQPRPSRLSAMSKE